MVLQTTLRAFQAFQRIFIGVNRRSSAADHAFDFCRQKTFIGR